MDEPSVPPPVPLGRPIAITIMCVISLLGLPVTVFLIFSETARQIGAWYPPFLALSAVVGLASAIGFWLMRRWALWLYAGFMIVSQVALAATGHGSLMSLLIPLVFVVIGFIYWPRME